MSTVRIGFWRFKKTARNIKRRYIALRRPALISVGIIALCATTIAVMSGALYFKNDVTISDSDGSAERKAFTMKDDPQEILNEFGYALGEFDRVEFSGMSSGLGIIHITRGFGVSVTADDKTFTAGAADGEDAYTILDNAGVEVNPYDIVSYDENKKEIDLIRGFGVNITADGETITLGTTGETFSSLLERANITFSANDIINVEVDNEAVSGDEIVIKRVTFRERTDYEDIPYEISASYSNLIALGEVEVIPGVPGKIEIVYGEKLIDGNVATSEVLSKETISEPSTEYATYGKALKTPYSERDFAEIKLENGLPVDYIEMMTGKATAYTAPEGAHTASGRHLQIGTVAVDPKIIPYGSLLYITSADGTRVYGAAVAADTGHLTVNNVLVDLFYGLTSESYTDACNWGARQVNVYIISKGVY